MKNSSRRKIHISTFCQGDICDDAGDYVPVTKGHDIIWEEKKHFEPGDPFPDDDRTWIPMLLNRSNCSAET